MSKARKPRGWRVKPLGPPPLCACGCGQNVEIRGRIVRTYVKNHHRRRWLSMGLTPREAKVFERLERVYGLTPARYREMLNAQAGVCAICSTDKPGADRIMWCVDHDHVTGVVRGLLCIGCNAGIGNLKDDPHLLDRAAAYLRRGGLT